MSESKNEIKTNVSRPALPVNSKLNQSLTTYVAAATAAGIGLFAATTSAEAKIVYTPANQILHFGVSGQIPLDINGDGIADIYFTGGNTGYNGFVVAGPAAGNGIIGAQSSAAALAWGVRIGPKDQFEAIPELMQASFCKTTCSDIGPWAGKYNRFLGVKFEISGQTHYGWVNLNMTRGGVITGYAYETIPNKPLVAGEKTEPTVASLSVSEQLSPSAQPATLGMLARGADGLAIWRRDNEMTAR